MDAENIRSQKAVLKLGAKKEGLFRSNYLDAFGMSRDDIYYSIVASEWNDLKEEGIHGKAEKIINITLSN